MLYTSSIALWRVGFFLLLMIIPGLVAGPAIPDIIVSIFSLFGLFFFLFNENEILNKNKLIWYLLIFYFYLNINSLFSYNIVFSLESSIFYLRFIFFSIFVYLLLKKFDSKLVKIFTNFYIILFIIIGLDSLKQYLTGTNFFGMVSTNFNRPSGLFGEELIIGSFFSRNTPLILSLFFFVYYKRIDEKNFYIILTILLISINLFVLISGERAALVLVLLIDFITFFLIPIKKMNKFKIILCLTTILIIALTFFDTARERMIIETYEQIFNEGRIYIFSEQHQSHYSSALLMFFDKPILGQGVNTFRILCSDPKFINDLTCSTHPHNSYIQLLSETGIIGFLFLLNLYIYSIYFFIKVTRNHKDNLYYYPIIFLITSFLINFFPFLPSNNFFNNWININYFFPLGFFLFFYEKFYFNK
jgi:O-antigen ligase